MLCKNSRHCVSFVGIKILYALCILTVKAQVQVGGAQWLSGRVFDSRPKGRWFEPHCVVVLEQDTFILA